MNDSGHQLKAIKALADEIDFARCISYREILKLLYQALKQSVEPYSYLLFSEDLGFGKNSASRLIIAGKRPLTTKAAGRVTEVLGLTGTRAKYFIALVEHENSRDSATREELFGEILRLKEKLDSSDAFDENHLRYIERWYIPIIREMTLLERFRADPEWIQNALGFPVHLKEIRHALKTLEEMNLIKFTAKGRGFEIANHKIHSAAETDSLGAIRYHQNLIELGKESIFHVPQSHREVVAQTTCIPVAALPLLKRMIRKVLDCMEACESGGADCEVFQINVQLFPVTKDAEEAHED